ncbi:sigma-70 family RNA polymerase sigma factor [Streptomyces sp. NPDC047072]|uniref:sigma-70 family RNA polymerase sigma factor n=1 Tax=Streptomyces sp. NPDC047072 TaxID=3154809 RepID=UPI0033C99429
MTTLAATAETAPCSTSGQVDDLIEEHRTALLAYARKLLTDHHLAEDIVQEAFIKAWRHAERLRGQEGSMRGWLLKVTRNLIIDRMRSAQARRETLTHDSPDTALPDQTESLLLSLDVVSLLRDLSPEHQEALVLIYVYGRTVNEVSHILGIPPGTVKSRQHYALRGLRKTHAGHYWH